MLNSKIFEIVIFRKKRKIKKIMYATNPNLPVTTVALNPRTSLKILSILNVKLFTRKSTYKYMIVKKEIKSYPENKPEILYSEVKLFPRARLKKLFIGGKAAQIKITKQWRIKTIFKTNSNSFCFNVKR